MGAIIENETTLSGAIIENETTLSGAMQQIQVVEAVSPAVTLTEVAGGVEITVEDVHGTQTATVHNGQAGDDGADGTTFTPSVSAEGVLSWSNKDGKPNPPSANIKGPEGEPGADGVSPTVTVSEITGGHEVTITDAEGEHSFDVMDGEPGAPGQPGADGVGVPAGGTAGQVLKKASGTDYDTEWANESGAVTDVQVNGTSIVSGSVANVPVAGNTPGVVLGGYNNQGIVVNAQGKMNLDYASVNSIKNGIATFIPITCINNHAAVFYGLAKAAGDTTQSASSNAVGAYTDNALDKILAMLGVTDLIAQHETSSVSAHAYAQGECFIYLGKLYRATAAIAVADAITPGTNCEQTTLMAEITR